MTTFWKQIKDLKIGQIIKVPTRSSNNLDRWEQVEKEGTGPCIKYVQNLNDECMNCSLASAFHYMKYEGLAKLVISEYMMKISSNGEANIGKLVSLLHNKKPKGSV